MCFIWPLAVQLCILTLVCNPLQPFDDSVEPLKNPIGRELKGLTVTLALHKLSPTGLLLL